MIFQNTCRVFLLISLALSAFYCESKLPNRDRLVMGSCMRYWINPVLENETKTTAELLGVFCNNLDGNVEKTERATGKFKEVGLNLVGEIRHCVAITTSEDLVKKYSEFGKNLLDEVSRQSEDLNRSGEEDSHRQQAGKESLGSTFSSGDEKTFSTFKMFAKGLCETSELVAYDHLNEDDKKATAFCSLRCVTSFFKEIQNEMHKGIEIVRKTRAFTIDQNLPNIDQFFLSKIQCVYCPPSADISYDIATKTKNWLRRYNYFYTAIRRKASPMHITQIDENLSDAYFNYQSCMKWECGMKNHSEAPSCAAWLDEQMKKTTERDLYTALLIGPEDFPFSLKVISYKIKGY